MTRLSATLQQVNFGRIVRSVEALTMIKPAALVVVSFLAATLVAGAGAMMAMASIVLAVLVVLFAVCIAAAGVSGSGVLLMDQALEIEPRGMLDAGVFGFMCLLKAMLLGLIYLAILLAIGIVVSIVFAVCKIPWIGPLVLVVVFPPIALVYGVIVFSLFVVVIPLTMPALWEGKSVTETLGIVITVVRERLIIVVLSLLALYLVCSVVGGMVGAVILGGISSTAGHAISVLGYQNILVGFMGLPGAFMGGKLADVSGHALALSIDLALMLAVVAALLSQVWILGINLVYLSAIEGLDTAGAQQAFRDGLAKAKAKAEEVKRAGQEAAARARHAAEEARAKAAAAAAPSGGAAVLSAPAPAVAAAVPHCPACNGVIAVDDVFCGNCGHKLG